MYSGRQGGIIAVGCQALEHGFKISWDLWGGDRLVREDCWISRAYLSKWRMILIFSIYLSPPPTDYTPYPAHPACNLWGSMIQNLGALKYEEDAWMRLSRVICGGRGQVDREDQDHPSLTKVSSANPTIFWLQGHIPDKKSLWELFTQDGTDSKKKFGGLGPYLLTVLTWDLTQDLAWTRTESHLRLGPGPSQVVFTKENHRDSIESRRKSWR